MIIIINMIWGLFNINTINNVAKLDKSIQIMLKWPNRERMKQLLLLQIPTYALHIHISKDAYTLICCLLYIVVNGINVNRPFSRIFVQASRLASIVSSIVAKSYPTFICMSCVTLRQFMRI